MINRTVTLSSALATLLLLPASLTAQTDSGASNQAQPYSPGATAQASDSAASFSDTELQSFAEARDKVDEVRMQLATKLSSLQDPEEVQRVQKEADMQMIAAVENAGLTRERYNEISRAALSDPALAEKISQIQ
ncbi:DUF4168 domain-containing protein [Microbulbifer rhizosphaerae]|uniref:DUF4168 domain-containing protein n=1 Tax=Microbulbifer rhizosphaerae TaxID=1562603 RepID=A0A7W4WED9_9GAMM|nr:DUF4168 domain-containing protein [Microbulbifer rhizosphaerae]MBB3062197.1 hypothetical protein [Microbulbifer rhizosphaerae]